VGARGGKWNLPYGGEKRSEAGSKTTFTLRRGKLDMTGPRDCLTEKGARRKEQVFLPVMVEEKGFEDRNVKGYPSPQLEKKKPLPGRDRVGRRC